MDNDWEEEAFSEWPAIAELMTALALIFLLIFILYAALVSVTPATPANETPQTELEIAPIPKTERETQETTNRDSDDPAPAGSETEGATQETTNEDSDDPAPAGSETGEKTQNIKEPECRYFLENILDQLVGKIGGSKLASGSGFVYTFDKDSVDDELFRAGEKKPTDKFKGKIDKVFTELKTIINGTSAGRDCISAIDIRIIGYASTEYGNNHPCSNTAKEGNLVLSRERATEVEGEIIKKVKPKFKKEITITSDGYGSDMFISEEENRIELSDMCVDYNKPKEGREALDNKDIEVDINNADIKRMFSIEDKVASRRIEISFVLK